MIRQYLSNIINDHYQDKWKIQLPLTINFVSSKYFKETRTMYTNSDNIVITIGNKTEKIIEKNFESFLEKY